MAEIFGQTNADKLAEENLTARQIVKEINHFGISERQRQLIIYYLILELEDIEKVQTLSEVVKEVMPDITITGLYEGNK